MQNAILVLHLIICMVLVGAVLMQRSEGGALGMGGGGAGGLISGRGAADMMVNITSWVGGLFFATSLVLAVLANTQPVDRSVITSPGERPGFQFTLPDFLKGEKKSGAPTAATPAPAPTIVPPLQAPIPDETVIRAGPLETLPPAPVGAGGPRTPPPAASLPAAATKAPAKAPVGAPTRTGAAPSTSAPVGSQKATATAPLIPLPAATPPASPGESAQLPDPALAPEREKAGPDE